MAPLELARYTIYCTSIGSIPVGACVRRDADDVGLCGIHAVTIGRAPLPALYGIISNTSFQY